VILNEHDFWDVPEDNAQPLLDTLSARSKAGWTLVLADGMSKERILGVGRAMRPVLRQDRALLRAVELGQ